MLRCQLLKLQEDVPDLSLIADGLFEPSKLLGTQGHCDCLGPDSPGPLITGTALARFIAFHQAAEGDPADAREFPSQALVFRWQVFFACSH